MSNAKFASITAGLLARKGEAMPWVQSGVQSGVQESETPAMAWRQPVPPPVVMPRPPVTAAAVPPSTPSKEKSCSIRMSAHDYERLGIVAVKTGSSRAQLLKDALAQFLASQANRHGCQCLKPGAGDCRC